MKPTENKNTALENAKEYSRRSFRTLWEIVDKYRKPLIKNSSSQSQEKKTHSKSKKLKALKILRFIPGILIFLFGFSFFWDFNNLAYQIFGHTFYFEGLLRIMAVSGLIGYGTNWLAITMLFKPVKKHPLLGHGLIPAQKARISARLAQAVAEDLINPEIIKQKIHESEAISRYRKYSTHYIKSIIDDPEFRRDLKGWAVQYVDDMIANPEIRAAIAKKILIQIETSIQKTALEKAALKTYTFVKGQKMQKILEDALTQLPSSVESGLDRFDLFLDNLPGHIEKRSDAIEQIVTTLLYSLVNQLNVQKLVEEKLQQYDEQRLSDLIWNATNEQLQYIQYLGAVLGVIGGFLIWEPFYCLIILMFLITSVFITDYLLLHFT